jgi:hypothetical protein
MLLEKSLLQNKIIPALIINCLLAIYLPVFAGQVGGLSGAYLRPGVGASALAMGGASSAAPEYYGAWWNPAYNAFSKGKKFSLGAGTRSMGRTDLYSEFDLKVPPRLGIGFLVLYRGDPFLDNLYNDDYDNPQKLDDASYTTFTGKISLNYFISRKLSAGLNIGIHYQRLPTSIGDDAKWVYSSTTGIGAIDLAAAYKLGDKLTFGLVIRDMFALMTWELADESYSPTITDRPLPSFTIAGSFADSILQKPFRWNTDLKGYLLDGEWNQLERPEAYLSSGIELQNWKSFYLRLGLGDILLNGDIFKDSDSYFSEFFCKITGGFSVDFSNIRKGMVLNYGFATDKTWAGMDHQLDLTFSF